MLTDVQYALKQLRDANGRRPASDYDRIQRAKDALERVEVEMVAVESAEYRCPKCGHPARKIEDTEPDAVGEYKTSLNCDSCDVLFYMVHLPKE